MMAMLGGLDGDERTMLMSMIQHFVAKLNEERAAKADVEKKLAACRERISLLETAAYGLF
jgi:hypothetical protein